jgi:ABC-type amino acid transport substrate-binding protein
LLECLAAAVLAAGAASARGETVTACFDEADRSSYAYPDADGEWRGATMDLVKELARQAGLNLALQPLPWARCLRLAKTAGTDAVDFAFYASANPQRQADYAFVGPVHRVTGGAWLVDKRAELPHAFTSFTTLGRYRLCGITGANYAWLKDVGVDRRVDAGAHTVRAAVTKLSLGRCDYLLATAELQASAERHGVARTELDTLRFAPYPRAAPVAYYLLFNKQQPAHAAAVEAFSAALERLSRSGAAERVYRGYGLAP